MIRIDRLLNVILATSFALLPSAAVADCRAWELLPKFTVKQANGANVVFELSVTDGKVVGSAYYFSGANRINGKVTGSFQGPSLDLDVLWPGDSAVGQYVGGIGSSGSFSGVTKDLQYHEGQVNGEVHFRSPQTFRCLSELPPPPPPPPASPSGNAGAWAAVAADGNGRWGYAVGQLSQDVAISAALQGCGDSACKILDALQAQCIAYAQSREGGYWYFAYLGPDLMSVQSNALNACIKAAPAGSCKLVKARCS